MFNGSRYLFSLDTADAEHVNPVEFCVKGWLLTDTLEAEAVQMVVVVDGEELPVVTGCPRPDVAAAHSANHAENCGFFARFDRPKFDPTVKLKAYLQGETTLAELTIPIKEAQRGRKAERSEISTYRDWLTHYEESLFWPASEISQRISRFTQAPLFSIVLRTAHTVLECVKTSVNSVRKQYYGNWRLVIIEDGSNDSNVVTYLTDLADSDNRIEFRRCDPSLESSKDSNNTIDACRSDYTVFLDQGDELHPYALLEAARYLNEFPTVPFLYSDEDVIDRCGIRTDPAFKPDFDLDMFRTCNYLGNMIVVQTDLAKRMGGFHLNSDAAQDWDFLLRVVDRSQGEPVGHIAKPLYHRLRHNEKLVVNLVDQTNAGATQIHALSEHLRRTKQDAAVEPGIAIGTLRVKYGVRRDVKAAVLFRLDDGEYQRALIQKLFERQNGSIYTISDYVLHRLARSGKHSSSEFGLSSLNDIQEDVLIFINRPLESLNHGFFDELTRQATRSDCGLVTGISLDANSRIVFSGYFQTIGGDLKDPFAGLSITDHSYMDQLSVLRRVEAISDYFFATDKRNVAAVGGLSSVSSTGMPLLLSKLLEHTRRVEKKVLVTPFAVATFDEAALSTAPPVTIRNEGSPVSLNSNLELFTSSDAVKRGQFQ